MKEHRFRVWNIKESRMYFRGYQKLLFALLCEDDGGANEGRGRPVKRVPYGDCVFLESTGVEDKHRREIFEGDIVRVRHGGNEFRDVVGTVPDTFGSGAVHPLTPLLKKHGVQTSPDRIEIEVLGNEFENSELLNKANQ